MDHVANQVNDPSSRTHLKIQEQAARMMQSYEGLQTGFQKMLQPYSRMQAELQKTLQPYSRMQAELQKTLQPYGRVQAELQKMLQPYSRMQAELQKALQPYGSVQAELQKMLQPYSRMQAELQKALKPYGSVQAELQKMLQPYSRIQAELQKVVKIGSLQREFEFFQPSDADFQATELAASSIEATSVAVQLVAKATSEAQGLQDSTALLISAIEAQPTPEAKAWLWMVMSYVLGKFLDAVVDHIAELTIAAALAFSPSGILEPKQVKQTASQVVGISEVLQDHRYVKADVLNVRQNPGARSPLIAQFRVGQSVRLIEKDKNGFALVVWSDLESGVEIRGWVFARYLAKFR